MAAIVLEAKGLSKQFGGLRAVHEVDLAVALGEIHSIIGPNGAGKTTIFNLISGFLRPDAGVIRYRGQDVTRLPAYMRARAGIVRTFQNIRLFRHLSVLENVLVGQQPRAGAGFTCLFTWSTLSQRALRAEAEELLEMFGLSKFSSWQAGTLPYGMQKRVELARALAAHPVVLLLDEPTAGMPPQDTEQVARIITAIRDQGITVVLVEHDMDVVMGISDRISVLNFGQKIAEGRPQEIRNNGQVIEAYLGREG